MTSQAVIFEISNSGILDLEVSGIISNSGVFTVSGISLPVTIIPDSSETFNLIYTTDDLERREALINIYSNNLINPFIFTAYGGVAPIFTKGYIAGGGVGVGGIGSNSSDEYDPSVDSWTSKSNMADYTQLNQGYNLNDYGYSVGGYSNSYILAYNYRYDQTGNTWDVKQVLSDTLRSAQSFSIDNKGYVVGGYGGSWTYYKKVRKYIPSTDTWELKTEISANKYSGVGFTLNDYGYTAGGVPFPNSVEKYNSILDSWETKTNISRDKASMGGFSLFYYPKGYIVGGTDGSTTNETEEYNPSTDTWVLKDSISNACAGIAGININLKGYAVSTEDAVGSYDRTEEYDSESNIWSVQATSSPYRKYAASFGI